MEYLNNTSDENFTKLCEYDNTPFAPQISHDLLLNGETKLYPPILLNSSYSIKRYTDVWAEKVLCDKILISGVIYNKIIYDSVDKYGGNLHHVVKCYNTPFQCLISYPCNDTSTCPNDYAVHTSINSVIYSNFSCINSLCNSCKLIGWKLSEKYLIYITVKKKCRSPICEDASMSNL
ncbi:hypothetical protein [Clostridium sp.]|uniref:hypothetical protein n=1 Tax=Clostridium sp. TaxID=1506 RepID=UPI003216224D